MTFNEYLTDVVVIGAGFAGLTSAVTCAQHGVKVLVLEKMQAIGGNSIISDGGIAAAVTKEQNEVGINDSVTMFIDDMLKSGEGLNSEAHVKLLCMEAADAYQWTKTYLEVPYLSRVDIFGGHQVPRCYTPTSISGRTLIQQLKIKLESLGGKIITGARVEDLLFDDHKTVIGVKVNTNYRFRSNNAPVYQLIKSTKGVIIASGGFAGDVDYCHHLNPLIPKEMLTTNKLSADAQMLNVAQQYQAATINLDQIQCIPWTTPDESGYHQGGLFGDYIVSSAGILIDPATCKRFVNEQGNRKQVADQILNLGHWVLGIVDQSSVTQAGWDLTHVLSQGIVKAFDDWSTLASAYQLSSTELITTIANYNQQLMEHHDEFTKIIDQLVKPLVNPPYYVMRIFPKTHYTCGGLVTDLGGRVLNHHQPINHLFAVGEVTGMMHGANRLGSCSISECLVMGRVVGDVISTE
jgi:flavocytochrome c